MPLSITFGVVITTKTIGKLRLFLSVTMLVIMTASTPARAADWLQYIASYGDLIQAFGANPAAGEQHYLAYGRAEGRQLDIFDENQYLANYPDLQAAFGTDGEAATIHFINYGYNEGRTALPPSRNVLLIIADDMGVDVSGFYPASAGRLATNPPPPPTPTLQAPASQGVVFSAAWAYMECSPTRATIFTGRYGFRTGVGQWINARRPALSEHEFELPEAITTASPQHWDMTYVGKWHLSHISEGLRAPNRHGWPYYIGPVDGGALVDYFDYEKNIDGVQSISHVYAATDQVNDAMNAIRLAKSVQHPFFVTLAFNAPHQPYHLPPVTLHDYDFLPPYAQGRAPRPYYEAMIQAMDTEIGRLLQEVDLNTTTVIFIGDNGTPGAVLASPYRGGKSTINETGIRVPLLIAGAGIANPGRVVDGLASSVDLYPTVLALLGIDMTAVLPPGKQIDGVSLMPYLGAAPPASVHEFVYSEKFVQEYSKDFQRAIRNLTFKLVVYPGDRKQFFNLIADPLERTDLLSRNLSPVESANLTRLSQQLDTLIAGR